MKPADQPRISKPSIDSRVRSVPVLRAVVSTAPVSTPPPARTVGAWFADHVALTKPRLVALVLVVTGVGFFLGSPNELILSHLLQCLLGTALLGGGASALNQLVERRHDALMKRTESRPIACGRMRPWEGLVVGSLLGLAGSLVLSWSFGYLAGLTGVVTLLSYVLVYTPLKRRTRFALHLGAIPGALPPMIGWIAARGTFPVEAWAVCGILFVWQIPHFAAIGWIYREDYRRAGFRVLSVEDEGGRATALQIILNTVLLILVSFLPVYLGLSGKVYLLGAVILGAGFLGSGLHHAVLRSTMSARWVLRASLVYLPVLFLLMMMDRI